MRRNNIKCDFCNWGVDEKLLKAFEGIEVCPGCMKFFNRVSENPDDIERLKDALRTNNWIPKDILERYKGLSYGSY